MILVKSLLWPILAIVSRKEFFNIVHCYLLAGLLMVSHELLHHFYQDFLYLTCQHLACLVFLANFLEFLVIFQEESQILIGNVNR